MSAGFAHLHCHTEYSVLDGATKIHELLDRCREFNMTSCAITDHGTLFGAVEFYQEAKKANIKPIIGCELYVAREGMQDRSSRSGGFNHFLVLCESTEGYHNLCKLSSLGFLEGFYYKPRVDDALLAKYNAGLIATSSCLAGQVPQYILQDNLDAANATIKKYVEIFGKDRYLIELMDHGMPEQKKVNPFLAEMAEHHGLTLIATNDCHYLNKEDAEPHEALLCIQTNGMLDDDTHFKFPTDEVYVRSPDEMRELFARWPEAVSNTEKIAERCNVEIPLGQHLIPEFVPPEGIDKIPYLEQLVFEGLKVRYGDRPPEKFMERCRYELEVIEQMGFVDYFLVVWDLIRYARQEDIPVGPGRGSGAGSIVAYALKITNIDPMRYHLLFERFLNPERISMPDFDIDFCYVRREEMIEYAREKYGKENVCQIITFGRMLAKQVIRNVARVMGMPYAEADRIAKLIPDELKITLKKAYDREPELKELVDTDPQVQRLWKLASRLEGTIGNCGTHAAGVVICDKPLMDYVALYKASGTDIVATQVEMKSLEEVGLLKMDFLGLRTLTVVHDTTRLVKRTRGIDIDIDNLEPNDAATYALLRSGKTTGVFQLESSGMRDLAKRIGLESLEEVCALVALFRPGPMQFIDTYIKHKHHPDTIKYDHPLLEPILQETYGIAVYQEQVMEIVQAVAGFTLGQADILRRAMGKKSAALMAQQREKFVEGCHKNGIDGKLAVALFDKIETFAGYGFNKSHSMAYAFVAYQTAFLKANYPVEFMAALLTSESGNLDKTATYVEECKRLGIDVLPPDINRSRLQFTPDGNTIRFGLAAVKNVGKGPAEAIVVECEANGPYKDIYDFCSRIESHHVNRRIVESLNKTGAFLTTGWNRAQTEAVLENALSEASIAQRERESGQGSLLDLLGGEDLAQSMHEKPTLDEWPEKELLAHEKEMIGLFISSHPLDKHREALDQFTTRNLSDLSAMRDGKELNIGGLVGVVKLHITQKGKKMAFLTIETLDGPCEVTVFSDTYEKCSPLLVPDAAVIVRAHVNFRNDEAGLIADDVMAIEDASEKLTRAVHIRMDTVGEKKDEVIGQLALLLGENPGGCDVYLHCNTPENDEVTVHATSSCMVAPSAQLKGKIEELLGTECMWYSAGNGLPRHG